MHAADPVQGGVVEHHHLPVPGQLHIQLDAVTLRRGGLEGGERVFRDELIPGMQSAVGKIPPGEGRGRLAGHGPRGDEKHRRARGNGQPAVQMKLFFDALRLTYQTDAPIDLSDRGQIFFKALFVLFHSL